EGLKVPAGGDEAFICNVKTFTPYPTVEDAPVTTYFLENQEYYEKRDNIYGYTDDSVRWALLSRGVLEFIRAHKDWRPDVIVASDWQAGLIPNYLHTEYKDDPVLKNIPVVFSIHNLFYQGMFNHRFVSEMDYDSGQGALPSLKDPKLLKINFMRRGIMYADIINTVSDNYSKEIMTPEYGELLDDLLRERRSRLYGILNGVDYVSRDPEADPLVEHKFNVNSIDERAKNKAFLQDKLGLPVNNDVFLMGIVSRLTEQKGLDLLIDSADALLRNFNVQLVAVGTGDSRYMDFFRSLQERYPKNVVAHLNYEETMAHYIFAGADAVLIPSKFEPCGLVQMEAMRYGAIPIVRKTGG
ncbi:MAG TPA: glycogen/starch synthase, partial [Candidatus Brocadiales bacterium]|nr:glycogen/starch synthase [Candidatus Brocadiales bacterium]